MGRSGFDGGARKGARRGHQERSHQNRERALGGGKGVEESIHMEEIFYGCP